MSFQIESDPNGKSEHEPGAKLDAGKPQPGYFFAHYFPRAMCAVADVGAAGAAKYTYRGWMYVPNGLVRYTDALMRHEVEIGKGDFFSRDAQLGVLHAAQVAWNALARLELILIELEKSRGK